MAACTFNGVEISEGLLESIAGGVLSDGARDAAYNACVALKAKGVSLECTLEIFSLADDPQVRADVLAFIEEIWPML